MTKRKDILSYNKNLELGLIVCLVLVILIPLVYANPSPGIDTSPVYSERLITVVDIPNTDHGSSAIINSENK